MYRFNVYQNFANGEFKLLTTYACHADSREEAMGKALAWAEATYPNRRIGVMPTN